MKRLIELRLKDAELPIGVVPKKPTNADRIRAMSDEELADLLFEFATKPMQGSFLKWLQQPPKEG